MPMQRLYEVLLALVAIAGYTLFFGLIVWFYRIIHVPRRMRRPSPPRRNHAVL